MSKVEDFTGSEIWTVETTLIEQHGEAQLAESEIRLNPTDRELTLCPVLYREDDTRYFVICKTANHRGFFYRTHQQYGTGVGEYDDIAECAMSLLQAQVSHVCTQQAGSGNS